MTDVFDANAYAHGPKLDFFNWAIIDAGAFDYAADAWGYSYGVAAEGTQSWWTLRAGLFDLSRIPNSTALETGFDQFELVAEAEERHALWGAPGKLKLLGFVTAGAWGLTTMPSDCRKSRGTYRRRRSYGVTIPGPVRRSIWNRDSPKRSAVSCARA